MTASSPPRPQLAEPPHLRRHQLQLPPPQLQSAAFSHQLSPPNPSFDPLNTPTSPRISHRASTDFRKSAATATMAGANDSPNPNGNAPVAVPGGPHARMGNGHAPAANMRDANPGAARSPPSSKSTSHVPCKFYRQGACQAGKACPFLHSNEPFAERAPCKYFTKGNCKFGPKCALAHILPNGHIVNRNNMSSAGHFSRVNVQQHHQDGPQGSSLLSMQAHMAAPGSQMFPYAGQEDYANMKPQYDMIPTIDTTFSSYPGSNYGSPPNENGHLPMSPVMKGLNVMDVQLPASFDSQGVSHIARYGPIASSVPARILGSSPPSSFQESPALRNLHDSAYGDNSRGRAGVVLGASPPESIEQPVGRRIMHSERVANRPKNRLSASVGARAPLAMNDDWDEAELIGKFEEDLLPSSLNDLLTPQEQMRRFSRDHGDNDSNSLSHRTSLSRLGVSPTASDMKTGSPSAATASPSRFQSLWGKSRPTPYDQGFESGSLPGASAFGHVGSPLRNSSLHPGASPALRAIPRPISGDASLLLSSPPRQASMSMISQQLQRTRLTSRASDENGLQGIPTHPGVNRVTSASSIGSSGGRLGLDRAVSSSSINRERIEEEQGLFSMEEEEDMNTKSKDGASTTSSTSNKRLSGLSWGSGGKQSPNLTPIGAHRPIGNLAGLGNNTGPWGNNA